MPGEPGHGGRGQGRGPDRRRDQSRDGRHGRPGGRHDKFPCARKTWTRQRFAFFLGCRHMTTSAHRLHPLRRDHRPAQPVATSVLPRLERRHPAGARVEGLRAGLRRVHPHGGAGLGGGRRGAHRRGRGRPRACLGKHVRRRAGDRRGRRAAGGADRRAGGRRAGVIRRPGGSVGRAVRVRGATAVHRAEQAGGIA